MFHESVPCLTCLPLFLLCMFHENVPCFNMSPLFLVSLCVQVTRQLQSRFVPSPTMIKSRIESLIDREYLERDRNDRYAYTRMLHTLIRTYLSIFHMFFFGECCGVFWGGEVITGSV